jgi:Leucine-rich repeat (LRR) protein
MTSYASMLKGGKSDQPALTAGNPGESELFKRVVLPEDHADRMPPEGKTPLSEDEIALLKFWIAAGAMDSLKVATARDVDTLGPVVTGLLPELAKYRRKAQLDRMKLKTLEQELGQLAAKLDVTIRRDSLSDDDLFLIAMKFPPAPFSNDQFRELRPYFDAFSKLSLASSGIDDAGLYYISQMSNVRELYLQKTKIEGPGIIYLQNLADLEVLNLSFTKIDDKAALDLLKIPNLREVYLYRTNTSMQVIEALRKYKPSVRFLLEEGPYY